MWKIEIRILFLVINLVLWCHSPLLDFAVVVVVVVVVANPVVMATEAEATSQGSTFFNVSHVTSLATQASTIGIPSIKTSSLHHLRHLCMLISPQLILLPSCLNLLLHLILLHFLMLLQGFRV